MTGAMEGAAFSFEEAETGVPGLGGALACGVAPLNRTINKGLAHVRAVCSMDTDPGLFNLQCTTYNVKAFFFSRKTIRNQPINKYFFFKEKNIQLFSFTQTNFRFCIRIHSHNWTETSVSDPDPLQSGLPNPASPEPLFT